MNFTTAEISALIGSYLWPMVRIAAVIATSPILGARYVPNRVKILLVLVLTVVIAPTVPDVPAVDPVSLAALAIVIQQLIIGGATGLLMAMVFATVVIGGEIIASKIGLGFASIVDPQNGVATPTVSQFYVILVSLVYVSLNGHLLFISELASSFETMPIATEGFGRESMWVLASWADQMFATAALMALPAVVTLFIVNLALGIVMRASPQFNILSIGFPVTLIVGFVIILLTLPVVIMLFEQVLEQGFSMLRVLLTRSA